MPSTKGWIHDRETGKNFRSGRGRGYVIEPKTGEKYTVLYKEGKTHYVPYIEPGSTPPESEPKKILLSRNGKVIQPSGGSFISDDEIETMTCDQAILGAIEYFDIQHLLTEHFWHSAIPGTSDEQLLDYIADSIFDFHDILKAKCGK